MSSLEKLKKWDSRRRSSITNVLIDHGFKNIRLPPSPYDVRATGSVTGIRAVQSTVVWNATAESYAKDKRIKNIQIFIYFSFNAEKKEILIQFRVTEFETESSISEKEKFRLQEDFDAMKAEIERQLIDALKIYGVWAPDI